MTKTYLDGKMEMIEKNINEIKDDVKVVLDKIAEGDKKYAKKQSVDRLRAIVWSIIGFVFFAVGSALVSIVLMK